MKVIRESKVRIKSKNNKRESDTLGITMELEKSLSIGDQLEKERKNLKSKKRRQVRDLIIKLTFIVLILVLAMFFFHINKTYEPKAYTQDLIKSDSEINIIYDKDNNLVLSPYNRANKEAIIIYPSSGIEPKGYIGIGRKLASMGYKVVIAKIPMNYPFFSFNKADKIISANPKELSWYLVAHNTSGEVAAKAATGNKKIRGVVFMGTYPISEDLRVINEPVLTIWGTNDGVLDFSKFNTYKANLPTGAKYQEIVGGNNTNFADVEIISKDHKARISAASQQDKAVKAIDRFILGISR